eukprot:TRINITY_DN6693_c0_g1_i1.p1 TRINITY_DN6693_c0_g1~~TRINITY_DN6693_c0_g1_i1.p1  ORF type:complete len:398 (-),score=84.42 TRINITY_DN6693_c0_g1_i1:200-1393(-)
MAFRFEFMCEDGSMSMQSFIRSMAATTLDELMSSATEFLRSRRVIRADVTVSRTFLVTGEEVSLVDDIPIEVKLIFSAGNLYTPPPLQLPTPSRIAPLDLFRHLVRQSRSILDQHVVLSASRYFSDRIQILGLTDTAMADAIYEEASRIPDSATRAILKEQAHIVIDGMIPTGAASRSTLLRAFRGLVPMVLKITVPALANADLTGWNRITKGVPEADLAAFAKAQHLAGPLERLPISELRATMPTSREEVRTDRIGIVMPFFACSLASHPGPLEADDLRKVARFVREALDAIHTARMAHNDVKPSNIFLDANGDVFLGDFGACSELGTVVIESSPEYWPTDQDIASEENDLLLLTMTLLELVHKKPTDVVNSHTIHDLHEAQTGWLRAVLDDYCRV